ncbi:hypothetical protein E2320_007441, partial [Naja naja]
SATGAATLATAPTVRIACSAWRDIFSSREPALSIVCRHFTGNLKHVKNAMMTTVSSVMGRGNACAVRLPSCSWNPTCPEGCLECDGSTRCRVCNSTTFLQKGLCVADCGRGVYKDPRNRQCKSSGPAPGFKAKNLLLVGIGGLKHLDGSLLEVENPESYGEGLLFRVAALPTNGKLVVLAEGKEKEQDYFTWGDVKEQRVFFVHDKMKSRNGLFFLMLSYQESTSEPVMFTVRAFSTQ